MAWSRKIRNRINSIREKQASNRKKNRSIWEKVARHSEDYMRVLKLNASDLEILESDLETSREQEGYQDLPEPLDLDEEFDEGFFIEGHPFQSIKVDGETFLLVVKSVKRDDDKGSLGWVFEPVVMVICKSNPNLNETFGEDNMWRWVNVVPEEWHQKIIKFLREGDSDDPPAWLPDDIKGMWPK